MDSNGVPGYRNGELITVKELAEEIKILKVKKTEPDGYLKIFYELGGVVGKFIPDNYINKLRKKIKDYSDGIKYLKGDTSIKLEQDIIFESEFSADFYAGEHYGTDLEKEYIEHLYENIKNEEVECEKFQQVINICEAGLIEEKEIFIKYFISEIELQWFDSPFGCEGELITATLGVEPENAKTDIFDKGADIPAEEQPAKFRRKQLQNILKQLIRENNIKWKLKEGVSVPSFKVYLITNEIKKLGFNWIKQDSVAVTLRKLGYSEENKRDY